MAAIVDERREVTLGMTTETDRKDVVRLRRALEDAGVGSDLAAFVGLVGEALRETRPVTRSLGGPSDLTEREIAELRAIGLSPEAPDGAEAFATATERTLANMTALLADSLSVEQVSARLGVHQSRVRQMLGERALYGIKRGHEWRVPAFQFVGERTVRNLGPVIKATPENLHPMELSNWFNLPDAGLYVNDASMSPREWLESGGDPQRASAIAAEL